jgi:hypothetical protein
VRQVWYVAYGSNLRLRRFRCYLAGGRPAGGSRHYAGCRDRSDPQRDVGVLVRGRLVFAGESGVWGGGMAFLDPHADGEAACRAYLVTPQQLADVAAQEMRQPVGGELARALVRALDDVVEVHTLGAGRYGTVARLGDLDGAPMFTITHDRPARLTPAAPSAAYLRTIFLGLHEAHGWAPEQLADYLLTARGVPEAWTLRALRDVAAEVVAKTG